MHREVGQYAKRQGISHLLSFGEASQEASQTFGEGAQHYKLIEQVFEAIALLEPAAILVKGSRSMRMERVVQNLLSTQESK